MATAAVAAGTAWLTVPAGLVWLAQKVGLPLLLHANEFLFCIPGVWGVLGGSEICKPLPGIAGMAIKLGDLL